MNDPPVTLAEVLEPIYGYYLRSLVDDDLAQKWSDDEGIIGLAIATAFLHVGGPVWWLARSPAGLADDTPYVIAKFDAARCLIRFDIARHEEVRLLRPAADFRPDGTPIR